MPKAKFHFPRTPLVVAFERHCVFADCAALNEVSLTKPEAIEYRGFDCLQCGRWNDDHLIEHELPKSWLDLRSSQSENVSQDLE